MAIRPYFCRMTANLNGGFAWQALSLFSPCLCFCDVMILHSFTILNWFRLWIIIVGVTW